MAARGGHAHHYGQAKVVRLNIDKLLNFCEMLMRRQFSSGMDILPLKSHIIEFCN